MINWFYQFPTWALGFFIIGGSVAFTVVGTLATRGWVERNFRPQPQTNEMVSYFLSGFGLFYGITLGLIAVATFQAYNETEMVVSQEAAALVGLYRDAVGYPMPVSDELRGDLRQYTRYVIHVAWPAQKKGINPEGGVEFMNDFEARLLAFEPTTMRQMAIYQNALCQYNKYLDFRQQRLHKVEGGLPAVMWIVTLAGAGLYLSLTWMFVIPRKTVDVMLSIVTASIVGLLIFLIVVLDRPFQGDYAVGAEPFELAYDTIMRVEEK